MKEFVEKFKAIVKPEKTVVKGRLPFIWLFGAGGSDIVSIDDIKSELSPSHKSFSTDVLSKGLSSNRSKFYQWLLYKHRDETVKNYRLPEQFHRWYTIDGGYTNLVDFELDLALISQCTVIFSESVGAYMEIGLFSAFPSIQKTSLIVAPKQFVSTKPDSFYYLGPIKKFKENQIADDVSNIWALSDSLNDEELQKEFERIKIHIEEVITNPSNKPLDFEPQNRGHIILLTVEILSLFEKLNALQITKILRFFNVEIDKNSTIKILQGLETLKIVISEMERDTEKFQLDNTYDHNTCLGFSGDSQKRFDRVAFKIEMKGGKK